MTLSRQINLPRAGIAERKSGQSRVPNCLPGPPQGILTQRAENQEGERGGGDA